MNQVMFPANRFSRMQTDILDALLAFAKPHYASSLSVSTLNLTGPRLDAAIALIDDAIIEWHSQDAVCFTLSGHTYYTQWKLAQP